MKIYTKTSTVNVNHQIIFIAETVYLFIFVNSPSLSACSKSPATTDRRDRRGHCTAYTPSPPHPHPPRTPFPHPVPLTSSSPHVAVSSYSCSPADDRLYRRRDLLTSSFPWPLRRHAASSWHTGSWLSTSWRHVSDQACIYLQKQMIDVIVDKRYVAINNKASDTVRKTDGKTATHMFHEKNTSGV